MPIGSVSFTAQNKQGQTPPAGSSVLIPKAEKEKGKMALALLANNPDTPVKSVTAEGSYVVIKGDKGEVKIECDSPDEAAAMVNDYNTAVTQKKSSAQPAAQASAKTPPPPPAAGKKLYLNA